MFQSEGAGMYVAGGTVTITGQSDVSGNSAGYITAPISGGGIYNTSVVKIEGESRVSSNIAASGAGIYNTGSLTITDSHVDDNLGNYGWGAG